MNQHTREFDPFEGCTPGGERAAQHWLYEQLHLRHGPEPDFVLINSDRDRAAEFLNFFLSSPDLHGWQRYLAAELAVDSIVEFIEPEPIDDYEPAAEDVAEMLLHRVLGNPLTRHHLESYLRADMRDAGYYKRLTALVDRLVAQ